MGVTIQTKKNVIPQIVINARKINGRGVSAGAINGENSWLAGIHEYGLDIQVTPKMRAFLHHMGVHLKKDTTFIHIPERSFLRNGYDTNRERLLTLAEDLVADVIGGDISANAAYEALGRNIVSALKDYATALSSPADSDLTVNGSEDDWGLEGLPGKGSSNPLVDSGNMINSIDYEVE